MPSRRLSSAVSLVDIDLWSTEQGEILELEIGPDSDFALFVESVAIGRLYELLRRGSVIKATLRISAQAREDLLKIEIRLALGGSAFLLALLHTANEVREASGRDIKRELLAVVWGRITTERGFMGTGTHGLLLARDPDLPIPPFVMEREQNRFPLPGRFSLFLGHAAKLLVGGDSFAQSEAEAALITFIYEAFRNTYEHARADSAGMSIPGLRGISLQKIRFNSRSEISAREGLPKLVRDYFHRSWPESESSLTYVVFTVFDVGLGIHATLPPLDNEGGWERLQRAFLHGQTRHPRGGDIQRGEGLPNILEQLNGCASANAFLYLRSANIVAYHDFTISEAELGKLTQWPTSKSPTVGTNLSLVWPLVSITSRQKTLFAMS